MMEEVSLVMFVRSNVLGGFKRLYIHERTNMLDNVMKTEIQNFIDSEGEEVALPLTTVIDLKVSIFLLCLKRDLVEEDVDVICNPLSPLQG